MKKLYRILDVMLWYKMVLACSVLVYLGTYLGDAYRQAWVLAPDALFWLSTVGYVTLMIVPILWLLGYIEAVVVIPTLGMTLTCFTSVWFILGLIHGVVSTPFSVFGPLPWHWVTWWSLLHGVGLFLIIGFMFEVPPRLKSDAEKYVSQYSWRISHWID